MTATLLQVAGLFGILSLLAVGGGNGIIPAMQHEAVDVHHWMTSREFLDLFAISRAAPGPGQPDRRADRAEARRGSPAR